eukprot:CAMPEP_0170459766 /NCGR_PEP_ID=MMETSP0123-20130129/6345_1 /TAXON_ID=182087 /ORGANISM="Favella ehrenbergii, Strain Fehren 1" /LENGTH=50 /DNA_ID=CAMNT_0010724461 /DNA_START=664 /DNA_END=813 /DNA_ORIENTATION=+
MGYFKATPQIETEFAYCTTSLKEMLREKRQRRLAQAHERLGTANSATGAN